MQPISIQNLDTMKTFQHGKIIIQTNKKDLSHTIPWTWTAWPQVLPTENQKLSNFHCHNHQKGHRHPWQRRARIRSHRLYDKGYLAKMSGFQEVWGAGCREEKVPEPADQMTRLYSSSGGKRRKCLTFALELTVKKTLQHSPICSSFYKNETSTLSAL